MLTLADLRRLNDSDHPLTDDELDKLLTLVVAAVDIDPRQATADDIAILEAATTTAKHIRAILAERAAADVARRAQATTLLVKLHQAARTLPEPTVTHRGAIWIPIVLGLLPLAFAFDGHWHAPNRAVALADGFGLVGFGLLGAQAILGQRSIPLVKWWGHRRLMVTHRALAVWTMSLLAAHPLLLIGYDRGRYLPLLDPLAAPWRARAGLGAAAALLTLMAMTWRRVSGAMSRRRWLIVHRALFLTVIAGGLAHVVMVRHYTEGWEGTTIVAVLVACALGIGVIRKRISGILA